MDIAATLERIGAGLGILKHTAAPYTDIPCVTVNTALDLTVVDPERIINSGEFFDLFLIEECLRNELLPPHIFQETFGCLLLVKLERDDLVRKELTGHPAFQNDRIVAVITECGCSGLIRDNLGSTAGTGINHDRLLTPGCCLRPRLRSGSSCRLSFCLSCFLRPFLGCSFAGWLFVIPFRRFRCLGIFCTHGFLINLIRGSCLLQFVQLCLGIVRQAELTLKLLACRIKYHTAAAVRAFVCNCRHRLTS